MELDVGGEKVFVHASGKGDPVLLLHSSGLGGFQWRTLRAELEDRYEVWAPDLPGYGRSSTPRDGSYGGDLDVVKALIDLRRPPRIAGHSYGGFLGLLAAADVPVRALALYEPVAFGILRAAGELEPLAEHGELDKLRRFFDLADGMEAFLRRFVDYWNGAGAWDRLPEKQRESFRATAPKMHPEVYSVSADATPIERYLGIEAPVLVAHGSESTAAAHRVCEVLVASLRDARALRIDAAGHMGAITHARTFNAATLELFEEVA